MQKRPNNLKEIPIEALTHHKISREGFYVYQVNYEKGDSIIGPFSSAVAAGQYIEYKNVFGGCIFTGQQILNQFIPSYARYKDYKREPDGDDYDIELIEI